MGSMAGRRCRSLHPHELTGFTSSLVVVDCDQLLAEYFPKTFFQMATGSDTVGSFPAMAVLAICFGVEAERQRYDRMAARAVTMAWRLNSAKNSFRVIRIVRQEQHRALV